MEHTLIQQAVETPDELGGEEDDNNNVKVDETFQGVRTRYRFKRKTRSKVWEEYKPIFMNGMVQFAECKYCHNRMNYKSSEGTSHLWRHHKACQAKDEVAQRREKDSFFQHVMMNENEPVAPNDAVDQIITETLDDIRTVSSVLPSRLKSKVWKELTPVYIDGKLQAADCVHCHTRLSANRKLGRNHLSRHLQNCQARYGRGHSHLKDQNGMPSLSSVPNLKHRAQDELSPALTNGKVRSAEYSSRLPRASSSGDTSPIVRPSQVVPPNQPLPSPDVPSLKKQRISSATTSADIGPRKAGHETAYQELARMIASHGYPLSILEHEEMRRCLKNLDPMVNSISHDDMEGHCYTLFQKEKVKLKDKVALSSRRVSLSANIWTSDGAEPPVKYLYLTAHFIDEEWKVNRIVIKFGMFWFSPTNVERMIYCKEAYVPESELGAYNVMWDAIRDWNLDQKILSLTSVGEVRNDASTSKLTEMLVVNKCLPIRGKLYTIYCMDDVLNSIVSNVRENILHLVGDLVMDFFVARTSSSSTQQQLLQVISQMSLKCPREEAKWWHKFYFRLEVLLHFKKLFPSEELVSPKDARVAESICKILRTFYRAIEVVSGTNSPTANIYFNEVWKVRTVLQEEASNNSGEITRMVMKMQEAFSEYWQNSYLWLSIPVILDPRFKIGFIEFRLKRAFGTNSASYLSDIRETLRELFNEYCNHMDQPNGGASNSTALDAEDNDSLEDWDQHLNEQPSSQISSELDSYFEAGLVPRKDDFDILNWWMFHSTKYPILATIARDILAMPASAVQSGAAFSASGPVIPKHHSTLSMKTIEALVCTRDWMS